MVTKPYHIRCRHTQNNFPKILLYHSATTHFSYLCFIFPNENAWPNRCARNWKNIEEKGMGKIHKTWLIRPIQKVENINI